MKYIIKDWHYNILFNGKQFSSFEDAWSFIYKNVSEKDKNYDDYLVTTQ